VALALAAGTRPGEIPGAATFRSGPRGVAVDGILLEPTAVTRDRLDVVVDAGWIPRATLCRDAGGDPPPVCR
jgi:D-xylose transport system substrate-binding protein